MSLILPLLLSFLLTLVFLPITIKLAKKYQLVDDPKQRPHPAHSPFHKTILPRAGGLPIYLGIVLSGLILLPVTKHLVGIFIGISILLVIGLLDDKLHSFNPYLRLILLFVSAAAVVASGIGIAFITNPLSFLAGVPKFLRLDTFIIPFQFIGPHRIVIVADIFAFLWIVALTQVVNWSKGVDGQMPSITTVASLVIGFLSLRLYLRGDLPQLEVAQLAFITAGSSLAFLLLNWYPAKILPGFSGSTILAFIIATMAIASGAKVATALLVLAVPAADFIYTILRRIAAGKSPVWGDRGHLHHRLLDLGWNPAQIALFYLGLSAILGLVALYVDTTSKAFSLAVVGVIFTGLILWLNSFGGLSKPLGPDNG